MQTFGIEEKVKRMTPEEKKKFLEGRANMISLAGSLDKNFRNSTGMISQITEGGVGKTETHLDGGSKANSTMSRSQFNADAGDGKKKPKEDYIVTQNTKQREISKKDTKPSAIQKRKNALDEVMDSMK